MEATWRVNQPIKSSGKFKAMDVIKTGVPVVADKKRGGSGNQAAQVTTASGEQQRAQRKQQKTSTQKTSQVARTQNKTSHAWSTDSTNSTLFYKLIQQFAPRAVSGVDKNTIIIPSDSAINALPSYMFSKLFSDMGFAREFIFSHIFKEKFLFPDVLSLPYVTSYLGSHLPIEYFYIMGDKTFPLSNIWANGSYCHFLDSVIITPGLLRYMNSFDSFNPYSELLSFHAPMARYIDSWVLDDIENDAYLRRMAKSLMSPIKLDTYPWMGFYNVMKGYGQSRPEKKKLKHGGKCFMTGGGEGCGCKKAVGVKLTDMIKST